MLKAGQELTRNARKAREMSFLDRLLTAIVGGGIVLLVPMLSRGLLKLVN
jgi:hypothetical protein